MWLFTLFITKPYSIEYQIECVALIEENRKLCRYRYHVSTSKCGTCETDIIHKSHNAPVPYPTMFHSEQKCADICSEWNILGYGTGKILGFIKLVYWCSTVINYSISCSFILANINIHWHFIPFQGEMERIIEIFPYGRQDPLHG